MADIDSSNYQRRQYAERSAINAPMQGTAADLIKIAMTDLHQRIIAQSFDAKIIMQVHDELVFECPPHEEEEMRALVKKEMEQVMTLKVPLVVDIGWGENWNDAH